MKAQNRKVNTMKRTIMVVMVVVLAIGGISFGAAEKAETPLTDPHFRLINVSKSPDLFKLIEIVSSSEMIRNTRSPEFLEDVIKSARKDEFVSDDPVDSALADKKNACHKLVWRVRQNEEGDVIGKFLKEYDAADKKLKQAVEAKIAKKKAIANADLLLILSGMITLFLGVFVGMKIVKKRHSPKSPVFVFCFSVLGFILLFIGLPFLLRYWEFTGLMPLTLTPIFFLLPVVVGILLKKHVMIDAGKLWEGIENFIDDLVDTPSPKEILGYARNLVITLASSSSPKNLKNPIDGSSVLMLVESLEFLLKEGGTVDEGGMCNMHKLYNLIKSAIEDEPVDESADGQLGCAVDPEPEGQGADGF